jgi:hypothetical protein
MNQVKTLCLAIVRTIILERRSVPTVAKAMDVVLDSYTRLMKMGGAYPGVRRTHEQNQQSGSQPNEGSHVVSQEPSPGTTVSPAVNPDQASGAVNISEQPNSGVEHAIDRGLLNINISSDSADNTSDAVDKRQQAVGEASRPLSSGTLTQHGQHAGTVAISPTEMFQSVFTLVEDEMMGDPAYLIAVIMEFLRRYFLLT